MPAAEHSLDSVVEAQRIVDSMRAANECDKVLSVRESMARGYHGWLQDADGSVQLGTVTIYPSGRRETVYEGERYTRDEWGQLRPCPNVPHPDIGPGEEI